MADFVFDAGKGVAAEKVNDAASNIGLMLLKVAEADATLKRRLTLAAILAAANTEADATNYARKTGMTGTVTVDTTNDRTDVAIPNQTWTALGGVTNNTIVKLIVFYQDSAADSGRIPLTAHDFVLSTDGTDVTAAFAAAGFYRAT
jgi:Ca2+-binding RTX toxin-like protein